MWLISSNRVITREELKELVMGAAQDVVDQVTAQLGKAKDEILNEIQTLKDQVAAGEAPDFTALQAAAQALDDVVPDAPAEEPPAEPGTDNPVYPPA